MYCNTIWSGTTTRRQKKNGEKPRPPVSFSGHTSVTGINSMVDSVHRLWGPLPLVRRPRSFRNVPISKRIVVLAEALRKASRIIKLWETKPWPVKPMDLEKCHVTFMIHIHYINPCVFQRFSGSRLKLHQHFQGLKHEISLPHHNVFEIVPQPLTRPSRLRAVNIMWKGLTTHGNLTSTMGALIPNIVIVDLVIKPVIPALPHWSQANKSNNQFSAPEASTCLAELQF